MKRFALFGVSLVLLFLLALPALAVDSEEKAEGSAIVDPYGAYSYSELMEDLEQLEAVYPSLIESFSIGTSVDGRMIPAFYFGNGERMAIICATMHGREYVTSAFLMYMVEQYCRGYMTDAAYEGISYCQALDSVTFFVVPMLNPDGAMLSQEGLASVSEERRDAVAAMPILEDTEHGLRAWKSNVNGVDLNRNFPWKWGYKINAPVPANWEYIGPYAESEPESRAMQTVLDSCDYYMLSSLHSQGEVIYWMDTDNPELYNLHYPIANRFAEAFGYILLPPENTAKMGGFMVNSERYEHKRFCMTVEMGTDVYAPDVAKILDDCYALGLLMADEIMKMPKHHVDVFVDGEAVIFPDQQPVIVDGRTLAPLRAVLEEAGARVTWNAATRSVHIWRNGIALQLTIDDPVMLVNGEEVMLDEAPVIMFSRTMLPLRAIFEALGCEVEWDAATRSACITTS